MIFMFLLQKMYNVLSRYVQQMQLAITSQTEEDTIINYLILALKVIPLDQLQGIICPVIQEP